MADTIIVASRVHTAITIAEPLEDFSKAGSAPELPIVTIYGTNHTDTHHGMGITRGVNAEVFGKWLDAQKAAHTPLALMVFEISEDEVNSQDEAASFGFEPALDAMAKNGDNTSAAEQGSTVTHGGTLSSTEMAATSDTPADDTPRGDPDMVPTGHTQTPATALADPAHADDIAMSHSTPADDAPAADVPVTEGDASSSIGTPNKRSKS